MLVGAVSAVGVMTALLLLVSALFVGFVSYKVTRNVLRQYRIRKQT